MMRSNARAGRSLAWLATGIVVFACVLVVCFVGELRAKQGEKPMVNDLCYVCHLDLKTEEITTVHLAKGVGCDKCHGPSAHHMHDEMLMTKPDVLFGRTEVEDMCRTCHVEHKDYVAVEAFRKKWLGRPRPNGRAITSESVCTDCHGTHNIVKQMGTELKEDQTSDWITAFNGRDLTGWRPEGGALWVVEGGRIVGKLGRKAQGGELWTTEQYEDYLMAVTFRATWPIHAGIWLRAMGTERGPRVEIFENPRPAAFTGTVALPGEGLALVNLRQDLVDRDTWNTVSVKVEGDRVAVWLNGEEIGVVRVKGPAKGRIGLHIEKEPASRGAELCVREVLIQRIGKAEEKASEASGG